MRWRWFSVFVLATACSSQADGAGEEGESSTGTTGETTTGTSAGSGEPTGSTTSADTESGPGTSTTSDMTTGGSTGSSTDTDTDGETDGDPNLPGLDERPSNPTCIAPNSFPDLLSETGCVDPNDPTSVVEGAIPYEVNHPFWSDGADKSRWLAIPDGTTITVDAQSGDWEFPPGTVLIKEFRINGTLLETRLLVRRAGGDWRGQSYAWDDNQDDAQSDSGGITVNGIDWEIPSPNECLRCHSDAAGVSLGPETLQMNRDTTYPSTRRTANQLFTYDAIGLFSAPVGDPSMLPVLPGLDGPEPVEDRARAYIHANCSMCHRPGDEEYYDGRYTTPFAQQGLCGVAPQQGDLGNAANLLISPGSAANSIVVLRMEDLGGPRMPTIGSLVVDDQGVAVLSEWIDGLAACP
jgi:uncharacterized repeat protein (TIGR03806 family)